MSVAKPIHKNDGKNIIKYLQSYNTCITLSLHHTQKMKKKSPKKTQGMDREHKDVTCAVRLPRSTYVRLSELAKAKNMSLSDIMRDALLERMNAIEDELFEKKLKEARKRREMEELGLDPSEMYGG